MNRERGATRPKGPRSIVVVRQGVALLERGQQLTGTTPRIRGRDGPPGLSPSLGLVIGTKPRFIELVFVEPPTTRSPQGDHQTSHATRESPSLPSFDRGRNEKGGKGRGGSRHSTANPVIPLAEAPRWTSGAPEADLVRRQSAGFTPYGACMHAVWESCSAHLLILGAGNQEARRRDTHRGHCICPTPLLLDSPPYHFGRGIQHKGEGRKGERGSPKETAPMS